MPSEFGYQMKNSHWITWGRPCSNIPCHPDHSYTIRKTILLTPGNDRGVTLHSIDQSNQFRSRALRSIEHERVHDFHSKQFS